MKHILFLFALILIVSCQNQTSQDDGFKISGTLNGDYTDYVYLTYVNPDGSGDKVVDSSLVVDGQFNFEGKVPHAIQGWINARPSSTVDWIYIENSVISIETTYAQQEQAGEIYRQIQIDTVVGSESYNIKTNYEAFVEAHKNDENYTELKRERIKALVLRHPDHPFTGTKLSSVIMFTNDFSYEESLELFEAIDTTTQDKFDLKIMKDGLERANKFRVGNAILDVALPNVDDVVISTEAYRGKYTLVDFWASWCAPCRKKHPSYKDLYKKNAAQLEVFSISLDEAEAPWIKAMEEDQMDWTNVIDLTAFDGQTAKDYYIIGIPYSYLVDPDGIIVGSNLEADEIQMVLDKATQSL